MKNDLWEVCPECGSNDWEREADWEYDAEYASSEVECLDCGCIWRWVYEFSENQIVVSGGRDDDDFGSTSGSPLDLTEENEDE